MDIWVSGLPLASPLWMGSPSELTQHLIEEGAQIHYEENIDLIPEACKDKATI